MSFLFILFYSCSSLLYYEHTNTYFPPVRFMASLTPGESSSVSINHKDLIQKRTRIKMNGGGEGF